LDTYTGYFDSTKTGTNDLVGAFGLGSKSPFSYSSAFTVEAVKDGKKSIFAMVKVDDMPSYEELLIDEPTTKGNSVKIKIPIESRHIQQVAAKAKKVFKWFETPPVFRGQEIEVTKPEIARQFKTATFYRSDEYEYISNSFKALQGNILYPIDLSFIEDLDLGLIELFRESNSNIIVLDFPIGSVQPSASREELNYDERTKKAIVRKIEELRKEILEEIQNQIGDPNDMLDIRYKNLRDFVSDSRWISDNASSYLPDLNYQIPLVADLEWKVSFKKRGVMRSSSKQSEIDLKRLFWQLDQHNQMIIFVDSTNNRWKTMLRKYLVSNAVHQKRIFVTDDPMVFRYTEKVKKVEDLPIDQQVLKANRVKNNQNKWKEQFWGQDSRLLRKDVNPANQIILNEWKRYYLTRERGKVTFLGKEFSTKKFEEMMCQFTELTGFNPVPAKGFYVLSPWYRKSEDFKTDRWFSFEDYFISKMWEFVNSTAKIGDDLIGRGFKVYKDYARFSLSYQSPFSERFLEMLKLYGPELEEKHPELKDFMDNREESQDFADGKESENLSSQVKILYRLKHRWGRHFSEKARICRAMNAIMNRICTENKVERTKKYPLLTLMDCYQGMAYSPVDLATELDEYFGK
jgi:hypothetical protein